MDDDTKYLVLYPDETQGFGGGPSSLIPTLGAATTAVDQYRTVAVHTNLPELGAAFTDIGAVSAIARVAEGGFTDIAELEAAETALQALLLHDIVHVVVAGPKADFGNGIISYVRYDEGRRTHFGHDLFSLAQSRDFLIAPEFLRIKGDAVESSSLISSPLVGLKSGNLRQQVYSHPDAIDALNVSVEEHGIPGYFTDPALVHSRRGDGFAKRFYHRIRQPWDDAVGGLPPIVCTFSLPPLLAVVLDRLTNRADLKAVISELRSELAPVRKELREFNNLVTMSTSTAEIEARVKHITESFDAAVPTSRLSGAERRQRSILRIQPLARAIIKLAMGYVTKSGATLKDGLNVVKGINDLLESRSLVDRTVTARAFAGLLNTESVQSLVKHHFSEAEIVAIERSIRRRH